ncbi:site-specific integrase [Heyndrickxia ginsengihumi]|uniref:site-specific integrase n=1 Tax=Heyndrickxia ginsengihumi TaxID=363870 RepID=UPI0004726016|nr:site-specific integrase [Heyndrickxia ginsengihumi]
MKYVEPIREIKKIETIKKILYAQNERDFLLFVLGINCPYRISDLTRIQIKDVLDQKGKVRSHLELKEKKTGKVNKVAIAKGVKKSIEQYIANHYTKDPHPEDYLFRSRKGINKPISRVQAWNIIKSAALEVGLENIGTHSLRKTFGYHQIKRGTNITLLMKMFNHSSEAVTLRYIGITQDDMDAAVQALDL